MYIIELIRTNQPTETEESNQNPKRPLEPAPLDKSDLSTPKKARFQIIRNPSYNADASPSASSTSLIPQKQLPADNSEASFEKDRAKAPAKVKPIF